jgi:hypothetical protein
MVKIAPDKSLPQTKNRGQRLTLTNPRGLRTDRRMGCGTPVAEPDESVG